MRYRQLCAGAVRAAGVVLVMSAPAAFAGGGWVDEVKLGLLDHDVNFLGDRVESGVDVNGEVRFHAIDWFASKDNAQWLNDILAPRPAIGGSVNTNGGTDFLYAGLVWTWDVAHDMFRPKDGLYIDFGFGGAIHDGALTTAPPGELALGSRALFHLQGEVGYRFDPTWSLSVYYDHYSNADLASPNPGINNVGMRVGYRF